MCDAVYTTNEWPSVIWTPKSFCVYVHVQCDVSRIVLNRSFRTACHRLKVPLPGARPVNYVWLLQQKNLQVLCLASNSA